MLNFQNSCNRSIGIRTYKSISVKLWPFLATLLLANLAVLSGCNKQLPSSSPTANGAGENTPTQSTASVSKIDVNSATIAELDKLELPGTKPSLSERIQGKRPYQSAEDLVTKKAISADELKLIKGLIVVGKTK